MNLSSLIIIIIINPKSNIKKKGKRNMLKKILSKAKYKWLFIPGMHDKIQQYDHRYEQ